MTIYIEQLREAYKNAWLARLPSQMDLARAYLDLHERNENQKAMIKQADKRGDDWMHRTEKAEAERDALREQNRKLREALEFYADRSYSGYDVEITDYGISMTVGEIIKDAGDKARAALAEGEAE